MLELARRLKTTAYKFHAITLIAFFTACAANPKPTLYPNEHLKRVGKAQADRDIAYCKVLAQEYVENPSQVEKTAKDVAATSASGAALGSVSGAISGNPGRGAAIGAATGGAAAVLHSLFKGGEPNPTYKRFVNHCLEREGYKVIGWNR